MPSWRGRSLPVSVPMPSTRTTHLSRCCQAVGPIIDRKWPETAPIPHPVHSAGHRTRQDLVEPDHWARLQDPRPDDTSAPAIWPDALNGVRLGAPRHRPVAKLRGPGSPGVSGTDAEPGERPRPPSPASDDDVRAEMPFCIMRRRLEAVVRCCVRCSALCLIAGGGSSPSAAGRDGLGCENVRSWRAEGEWP